MKFLKERTALLFPGQGSQFIGMGKQLADYSPLALNAFQEADSLLKNNLTKICWEGPIDLLNDTINTQPALLTHTYAALLVFQNLFPGHKPEMIAGHSLGEISALMACNSLTFARALNLVKQRGIFMKQTGEIHPGGMAAILGMDIQSVESICERASDPINSVQIANDNCPGQIVISGSTNALQKAIEIAKSEGAKRVLPLNVSIASHSAIMKYAQEKFSYIVDQTHMDHPKIPVISNVKATPMNTIDEIKQDIRAQLTSRVRWTESIQYMINNGINSFIEIGSGSVLSGLVKRIDKNVTTHPFGNPEDIASLLKQ